MNFHRYFVQHNFHARSYMWKRLAQPLDMSKTLVENGIPYETDEFLQLGMDPDECVITLHLYFKDDLSEA